MPITPFLDGFNFDAETKRVMGVAFEMTLTALRLGDWTEPSKEIIAKKIIALAREGLRDPNLLCEWTLNDLRKLPSAGAVRFSGQKLPPLRPRR